LAAIISRFAPAPTGRLHLGHVVNAVYVWGVVRVCGGRVLLRIEDHDRARSRTVFERAILEDLAWLGFVPDEAPVRQSERGEIYSRALDVLREQGLVYGCNCSRAQIAAATRALGPDAADATRTDELWYPGTCRARALAERPGVAVRIRLPTSTEQFVDLRHGLQAQRPFEQCGDLLARDRDGHWTYQFAATVDDYAQQVTLVIRGDDLLASTGRQIQLARLLGRDEPPRFLHHPLVMKSQIHQFRGAGSGPAASPDPAQKVSKSDGDTGIRDLRERGWTPPGIIGYACALAGLIPETSDVTAEEVSSMMSGFKEALL
jgi:glutamyl-tRNA synthetase/glutamyl-Q tRNA(Asp) synthetase